VERLDPRTIIVSGFDFLRQFLGTALIPIFLGARSGTKRGVSSGDIFFLWVPAGIGLVVVIAGVVAYFITSYGIQNGALVVRKRGLWRQERIIPLERIQNVTMSQTFLEKLLRVQTLNVETAASGAAEAKLKSLSLVRADAICRELLGTAHTPLRQKSDAEDPALVYRAELKDLVLAGALQNRAFYILAVVGGLFNNNIGDGIRSIYRFLDRSSLFKAASGSPIVSVLAAIVGLFLFLAIGWVVSIVMSVIKYHGFRVTRTPKGLDVQYGLFTTMRTTIPIDKIQSINTTASWMYRIFDLSTLQVFSVGGSPLGNSGEASSSGGTVMPGGTMLAPVARPEVVRRLTQLIYPKADVEAMEYRACHPYYKRTQFIAPMIAWLCVICAASFAYRTFTSLQSPVSAALWLLPVGLIFASVIWTLWSINVRYRRFGFHLGSDFLAVRTGTFSVNHTILPIANVQTTNIDDSPFSRKRGLANLTVTTPASSAVIPCITKEDAQSITDRLMRQKRRRGL
jgi:putative membrane protein